MVTTGIFFVLHSRINFNPHHREGGDSVYQIERDAEWISIHTTAKVVTQNFSMLFYPFLISIHTTAKVVTYINGVVHVHTTISIHTTAKVVTEQYSDLQRAQMISIHTTAKVVTKKEVRF